VADGQKQRLGTMQKRKLPMSLLPIGRASVAVATGTSNGNTYRAMEISSHGVFTLVERKIGLRAGSAHPMRCGVCHSDAAWEAQISQPLLSARSGHEVIGRIEKWVLASRHGRQASVSMDFSEVKMEPARPAAAVKTVLLPKSDHHRRHLRTVAMGN